MITFNLQSGSGNYYRGHKPSNHYSNCWGDREDALVFTLEQARAIITGWSQYLNIVIAIKSEPISDAQFKHELFCAGGGNWHDYKEEK